MGIYETRDNYYMIDYYIDGKRKWEHGGRTKADARYKLEKRRTEIREGKLGLTALNGKTLFKDFTEDYLKRRKDNKRSYSRELIITKYLIDLFGNKSLSRVTALDIENYRQDRLKHVKESTVNRETIVLRHMLNTAIKDGKLLNNPMKNIEQYRVEERKIRVLSKDEEEKLLEVSCRHLRPILIAALNTGMRLGELLNLKWEDVDLEKDVITVVKTKSKKIRTIPINIKLKETLKCAISVKSEYVFCDNNGRHIGDIKTAFKNALRRSGIKKCRFHDTRATFCSRLIEKNVNIVTVKELLGHADVNTTMRYVSPAPKYKKLAVELLNETVPLSKPLAVTS